MKTTGTDFLQVAILLMTNFETHRELLKGILRFEKQHGPWTMQILQGTAGEETRLHLKRGECDGVIGNLHSTMYNKFLAKVSVPAIIHTPDPSRPVPRNIPWIGYLLCDNAQVAVQAAEYFLERKFTSFAFLGDRQKAWWSEERRLAFGGRLARAGFACAVYPDLSPMLRRDFNREQKKLGAWLKSLPKPVAIFAANDTRARQALDTCLKNKIAVPQEAAVLGVDNDTTICESASPALSSVQLSAEQAGYQAAKLLDTVIRQRDKSTLTATPPVITYGFSHIVTRASTEIQQVPDILVARALEAIRASDGVGLNVGDLFKQLNVSRRTLETRFKNLMGRTIYAEILRVRLERVKKLLLETSLPVSQIAEQCGFFNGSHLCAFFHKKIHKTISGFRKTAHVGRRVP